MVSAVYRGDGANRSVQTAACVHRTCVHRTCNRYGVTGDRYGVGQSHPRCDPCYTLIAGKGTGSPGKPQGYPCQSLPVITGPIIPTGWLWAMLRMMPVPNCCPGNAGYRPCRFPSGGRKIPGIKYVPFSCLHNTLVNFMSVTGLEHYITLKKQSKKTRMLQSMHSQLFVVLLYPPAGSGCCRISCRYSLVLRKMPGIDGAGSQYLPLQYLQYPLLNYKLHLKHECQYNTYLILVL